MLHRHVLEQGTSEKSKKSFQQQKQLLGLLKSLPEAIQARTAVQLTIEDLEASIEVLGAANNKNNDQKNNKAPKTPIEEADIPDDQELMKQMAGRRYTYDNKMRRQVESKAEYKKRFQKSPDKFDALMLCYYTGSSLNISAGTLSALAARNR